MAEDLSTVVDRIVEENDSAVSAEAVTEEYGGDCPYADFEAPVGVDWADTSDMGGWRVVGVTSDYGKKDYRVWFMPEDE